MKIIYWYSHFDELLLNADVTEQETDELNYVANCIYDYVLTLQNKSRQWFCSTISTNTLKSYVERKWNKEQWSKQHVEVIRAIFERAERVTELLNSGYKKLEIINGELKTVD